MTIKGDYPMRASNSPQGEALSQEEGQYSLTEYNVAMTVCLVSKFNNSHSLVLVADKQSTSQIHQTNSTQKILKLNDKVYLLTAGEDSLTRGLYNRIKNDDLATVEDWANRVKQVTAEIRYQKAVDDVLLPRGYTHDSYLLAQPNMHRDVALGIDNALKFFALPSGFEVVIAGIDPDGNARVYYVGSNPVNMIGDFATYAAIGQSSQAYFLLNSMNLNVNMSYVDIVSSVFFAKKKCETVNGVGDKTDVVIIDSSGSRKLNAAKIRELEDAYRSVQDATVAATTSAISGIHE